MRAAAPRTLLLLALLACLGPGAAPAGAQTADGCAATFNGVAADRIATIGSPLELRADDTLTFAGTVASGTASAVVAMQIGPVTVESDVTTYATPTETFEASIPLSEVAPYGVGLFHVTGEADGCSVTAWVRVSGRFPLATLTGLTALGLALGGITGQLGAIASRNRWARSAAALGGAATGVGSAVVAQQFGILQLSYPSVAAAVAVAATAGFAAAWAFNPALRHQRAASAEGREPVAEDTSAPQTPPARDDAGGAPAPTAVLPATETPPPARAPDRTAGPFWCYVMAPTDLFDLTDHTRTVATLVPGTWYLAKRVVGGWAHVAAGDGTEGWVAQGAIHRHG